MTTTAARPVPALGPARTPELPTVAERTLPNGLRVLAVRRPGVPLVEVRLRVPFSGPGLDHIATAQLLGDTLLLGTDRRSAAQLAADLQALGGSLSASTDSDRLAVGGSVLAPGLGGLLELVGEVLTGAAYPDREVEGERDRLVQELAIYRSQAGVVAREALLRRMYGDHPYGRELPTADAVQAVQAEALRSVHAERVAPEGSVLVLVGDLDAGRGARRGRAGADRLDRQGRRRGRAPAARPAGRPGAAARPARRRADDGADVGSRADPHLARPPGLHARQPGLRWLLLVALGRQHPRGQGLHLQPALRRRPPARGLARHAGRRRRHRRDRARAARDVVRARPGRDRPGRAGRAGPGPALRHRLARPVDRLAGRAGQHADRAHRRRARRGVAARLAARAAAGHRRPGARRGGALPRPRRPDRRAGRRRGAGRGARRPGCCRSSGSEAAGPVEGHGRPRRGDPGGRRRPWLPPGSAPGCWSSRRRPPSSTAPTWCWSARTRRRRRAGSTSAGSTSSPYFAVAGPLPRRLGARPTGAARRRLRPGRPRRRAARPRRRAGQLARRPPALLAVRRADPQRQGGSLRVCEADGSDALPPHRSRRDRAHHRRWRPRRARAAGRLAARPLLHPGRLRRAGRERRAGGGPRGRRGGGHRRARGRATAAASRGRSRPA